MRRLGLNGNDRRRFQTETAAIGDRRLLSIPPTTLASLVDTCAPTCTCSVSTIIDDTNLKRICPLPKLSIVTRRQLNYTVDNSTTSCSLVNCIVLIYYCDFASIEVVIKNYLLTYLVIVIEIKIVTAMCCSFYRAHPSSCYKRRHEQ